MPYLPIEVQWLNSVIRNTLIVYSNIDVAWNYSKTIQFSWKVDRKRSPYIWQLLHKMLIVFVMFLAWIILKTEHFAWQTVKHCNITIKMLGRSTNTLLGSNKWICGNRNRSMNLVLLSKIQLRNYRIQWPSLTICPSIQDHGTWFAHKRT